MSGRRRISAWRRAGWRSCACGGPEESAAVIRGVLEGREGPALRIVLANAAAALLAAERVRHAPRRRRAGAAGRRGRPGRGGAGRVGSGKQSVVHVRIAAPIGVFAMHDRGRKERGMARKVILVTDPGIDGAFAGALALLAPRTGSGRPGGHGRQRPRRTGHAQRPHSRRTARPAALAAARRRPAGRVRRGRPGAARRQRPRRRGLPLRPAAPPAPRRQAHQPTWCGMYPKEVAILLLGPATVFARALDRDPELAGPGGAHRHGGRRLARGRRRDGRRGVSLLLRSGGGPPGAALRRPDHAAAARRDAQGRLLADGVAAPAESGIAGRRASCRGSRRRPSRRRPACTASRAAICKTCSAWWPWCSRRRSRRGRSPWTWRRAAS